MRFAVISRALAKTELLVCRIAGFGQRAGCLGEAVDVDTFA
jgi:hypothetical protein